MKKNKFLKVLCFALVVASLCSLLVFGVSADEAETYTFDSEGKLTLTAGYYKVTSDLGMGPITFGDNVCDVYCSNSAYGTPSSYFGLRKIITSDSYFVDEGGSFRFYLQSYSGDVSTINYGLVDSYSYILVTDNLDLVRGENSSDFVFTKYSDLYSYTFTRGVYGFKYDQETNDYMLTMPQEYDGSSTSYYTFNLSIEDQAIEGHPISSKIFLASYNEYDDEYYYSQFNMFNWDYWTVGGGFTFNGAPRYLSIDPELEFKDNGSASYMFEFEEDYDMVNTDYISTKFLYVTDTCTLNYLSEFQYNLLTHLIEKKGAFPGDNVLKSILSVALRVVTFLGTFIVLLCGIFYIDGSLTVIGYLAIAGLALAVILLVVYLISRFLKFRG